MATVTKNNYPLNGLAQRLDRPDRTLDGLAEAIPEAVASAVQQAVAEVMKTIVNVHAATTPSLIQRIWSGGRVLAAGVANAVCQASRHLYNRARQFDCSTFSFAWRSVQATVVQTGRVLSSVRRGGLVVLLYGIGLTQVVRWTLARGCKLAGNFIGRGWRKLGLLAAKTCTGLAMLSPWILATVVVANLLSGIVAVCANPAWPLMLALTGHLAIALLVLGQASWHLVLSFLLMRRAACIGIMPTT